MTINFLNWKLVVTFFGSSLILYVLLFFLWWGNESWGGVAAFFVSTLAIFFVFIFNSVLKKELDKLNRLFNNFFAWSILFPAWVLSAVFHDGFELNDSNIGVVSIVLPSIYSLGFMGFYLILFFQSLEVKINDVQSGGAAGSNEYYRAAEELLVKMQMFFNVALGVSALCLVSSIFFGRISVGSIFIGALGISTAATFIADAKWKKKSLEISFRDGISVFCSYWDLRLKISSRARKVLMIFSAFRKFVKR